MRIIFMGTPDFAVTSLAALIEARYEISAVVTAPDKPAGRGRKVQSPAVKDYALEKGLKILQPDELKSPEFLSELKELGPELIVVVAFRMLPEEVWGLPPKGTINLHASLLPQYRGAAPINWAIINGEKQTGLSTFFIEKDIDTGKIILQETVPIGPHENAGELHDRMMKKGAELLVRTVAALESGRTHYKDQSGLVNSEEQLRDAPKILKNDCRINWDRPVGKVYDHVRGLSPYPAAWTVIVTPDGKQRILKVYSAEKKERDSVFPAGTLLSDGNSRLEVICKRGILNLLEVQLEGKKRMGIEEFCRGLKGLKTSTII